MEATVNKDIKSLEAKERALKEYEELRERVAALARFLDSPALLDLDSFKVALLRAQYDAMSTYLRILIIRLDTWDLTEFA